MSRVDLLSVPLVRTLLRSRWPQFVALALALAGFALVILAGLAGTPVGNRNAAIVLVWIAWWALLMLLAVPFFGRAWCSVCPIPAPGEWLQRGALLAPAGRGLGLGRRWPRRLRNIWLQTGGFLLLALFSAVVLTQPLVTALVLLGFVLLATATALVFERRAFCRYLCPVGGFVGLYAQVAPIELRVRDSAVCAAHTTKTCYSGSADGYGCPWQVFPGSLARNTYCGTCLECLRTCPHDNIAINLRPAGADLLVAAGRRTDEAFKALVMLGSALVYAAVMLGPWGALKRAAYAVGTPAWALYALGFLAVVVGLLPGLFWLAVAAGRRVAPARASQGRAFAAYSAALVPLGLAAWMAFSVAFVFSNGSYIAPVLSDPLGWGWDLFGTAGVPWEPLAAALVPALQVALLLAGLAWASALARRTAAAELAPALAWRRALPVVAFNLAVTVGLLGLLVA
jgi:polyferredoxin